VSMRRYALPQLSADGRDAVRALLRLAVVLCDTSVYLLVGFAVVVELPWAGLGPSLAAFAVVLAACLLARAAHVFPLLWLCDGRAARPLPAAHAVLVWFAGLRGAIAVALSTGVIGPNAHLVRAATVLTVVATTFAFGGSTKALIDRLQIPTGAAAADEDAEAARTEERYTAAGGLARCAAAVDAWLIPRQEEASAGEFVRLGDASA
jgi:NhaP-type Na+/H+ or K+/H+ antiporter